MEKITISLHISGEALEALESMVSHYTKETGLSISRSACAQKIFLDKANELNLKVKKDKRK